VLMLMLMLVLVLVLIGESLETIFNLSSLNTSIKLVISDSCISVVLIFILLFTFLLKCLFMWLLIDLVEFILLMDEFRPNPSLTSIDESCCCDDDG
jgi:uncharacterized membrane protein